MNELVNCETCKAGGKLDSRDGKPWRDVTSRTSAVLGDVRLGLITPVRCPKCKGRGKVAKHPEVIQNPSKPKKVSKDHIATERASTQNKPKE